MSALLTFRDVQISMAGRRLLAIRELTLAAGRCSVLEGANGCGKTTLLKIAAGLLAPDHAQVGYGGMKLEWKDARRHLRSTSVYLHQHPYMFDCSVADNVAYGLRRQKLAKSAITQQVDEVLDWSGLSHLSQQNARSLSGGEKQRVAFARARVLTPQILLLDEPTSNMDRQAREQAYGLIRRLRDDGIGILIASHDDDLPTTLGDRHLVLADGALREVGPNPLPPNVIKHPGKISPR